MKKRVGYAIPIGQRTYDDKPIGSDIESGAKPAQAGGATMTAKPKIATISLAGCFGCHMSLLDIDERILKLIELVDFDKSPINDIKEFTGRCAVGIIEGGCCNEENVHVLQKFRAALRHVDGRSASARPWAACRPCATASRCRSAWTRRI